MQLRASATNMLAAESMGVNIRALRLIAWVLGGVVCGIAGALYAYYLGTVNARAFYFHAAFLTLAMHILGGMRSVTGAVVGVVLISVAMELIRHLESGPVILGAPAARPVRARQPHAGRHHRAGDVPALGRADGRHGAGRGARSALEAVSERRVASCPAAA